MSAELYPDRYLAEQEWLREIQLETVEDVMRKIEIPVICIGDLVKLPDGSIEEIGTPVTLNFTTTRGREFRIPLSADKCEFFAHTPSSLPPEMSVYELDQTLYGVDQKPSEE